MSLLVPRPERPTPRWVRWALLSLVPLSLLVHGVALLLLVFSTKLTASHAPMKKVEPRPVTASLRRIDSKRWAANRGASARTAQPVERPEPKPEGQIVDVAPGNDQKPRDSKFVAETNNTVQKETRAREQTNKYSKAAPKNAPNPEAMAAAKGAPPTNPEPPQPAVSGINLAESMLGRRERPTLFPSALSGTSSPEVSEQPIGSEAGTSRGGNDASEGGGAPNDALDVPEGDGTFLNTREWRYASFFNRVKQAVSAKWDPNGRLRAKGRQSMGLASRTTVMTITLRADGSLADAYVASPSGIDELDAEALAAFERAAPFMNPPAALVKNGVIRFQFGFQVTEDLSPVRFRTMRY